MVIMASANSPVQFSAEDAKQALHDVLTAFKSAENEGKLEEARNSAGSDMMKMMQIVFPVTTQIQMEVIKKYGFSGDGDGIIRFAQIIRAYEKQDPEVAELTAELRAAVIPQVAPSIPHQST